MNELMSVLSNNELYMIIDFDNFVGTNPLFHDAIISNFEYSTVEERDEINKRIENEILRIFNILLSRLDQKKSNVNILIVKSDVYGNLMNISTWVLYLLFKNLDSKFTDSC